MLLVEAHGEVVRYLASGRHDYTVRLLKVDDVHDTFEGELVEIQTVAHIVVCRHGFRIIVDHYAAVAFRADGVQRLHSTPVELNRRTDAVGSRTEHDDAAVVVLEDDVALHSGVGHIQIVCLCRILGGKRVYLLHYRHDAVVLAQLAHNESCLCHAVKFLLQTYGTGYLEIGESIDLCRAQKFLVEGIDVALLHRLIDVDDMLQFLKEPLVDLRQLMYVVNGISLVHSLGYDKHALVGRLAQGGVDIVNLQLLVLHEAVHSLAYHAESLLDCLLEGASDGHHLADRFHG